MRIALFDTIIETHVVDSLARALRAQGHEVIVTGKVWQGFKAPELPERIARIEKALERVIEQRPDAIVCMRSATLTAPMLARIRAHGIVSAGWFSDDPVLFGLTTGAVAPHYDVTLHTGDSRTLRLYEQRTGAHGLTFPFWCDEVDFPPGYRPQTAEHDVVFLGHMHNFVKQWRFGWLQDAAELGVDVVAYGKTAEGDAAGFARGELAAELVPAELTKYRLGLSFSQQFTDYAGTEFDYPGLAALGEFPVPSRVVQFACIGLPIISMRMPHDQGPLWENVFPEVLEVRTPEELATLVRQLRDDPARLRALSERTRERWQRDYSAERRARLLVDCLANPDALRELDIEARSRLFIDYGGTLPVAGAVFRGRRRWVRLRAFGWRRTRRALGRLKARIGL